jgi:hypothetical protein
MLNKSILKILGFMILFLSLIVFSSCTKKADDSGTKQENQEVTAIDENNFTESDEDLSTVDYKEFYDQLAPHGEWIQVRPEEIGLKPKTASSKSSSSNSFSLSNLLGLKDAYASSEVDLGMTFVWKPSTDLGVTMTAGQAPVYVPYTNGQWVNTDAGWYFRAPTPPEETVSHYGRWVNSPTAGWLWVPGRVWAPAWVDWRQNDSYVSWAPLPPSSYLVNGTMSVPVIQDDNYVIVERRYFIEPDIYRYNNPYYDNGNRILVSEMTGTDGIIIVNNTIINRGPDVNIIQNIYGRNIDLVQIQHVKNFREVRYSDREYNVYTPDFKRYKNKENKGFTINEPKSFKKYDDFRKEYNGKDNGNKNIGKDNSNKNIGKDNSNKNVGKDNGNKQKSYDNGNKQKGKDNGNKQKSYDNGNKQKGKDNGNKQKSYDNGNKQKGKDNGNKQKGNDNVDKQKGKDNGKGKK